MWAIGDQGHTLEGVLRYAPKLLSRLREEHGEKVKVGETMSVLPSIMGAPEDRHTFSAEIFVDGRKIGLYEHSASMFGVSGQKYNGKKTGDKPITSDFDDS